MGDRIDETLAALTLEEKVALLAGEDVWSTVAIERLGIPSITLADGPNGIRGSDEHHGPRSVSVPVGVAMGATFDPDLIEEVGRALARSVRAAGAHVLLGPTMNIPRVPVAGRNFECFSEDPYLSGAVAAGYVAGVQSEGVASCVKHVVCNDQETDRFSIDARVDDRALREIYLEPFRIAIDRAGPWAAMSAYNTINGATASEHPLLDDILRGEYGFDGLVVSDWYGTYSPGALRSGLDLEMPGPARWVAAEHVEAGLADGTLTEADLDRRVRHLLELIARTTGPDAPGEEPVAHDRDRDRAVARRAATESIVLLTNDGVLPLRGVGRIAVIGDLADRTPIMGGGSAGSHRADRQVSILAGLRDAVGDDVEVTWALGSEVSSEPPQVGLDQLSHADGAGLLTEYFDGPELTGEPFRTAVLERSHMGYFGPRSAWLDHERFAVRISGQLTPRESGTHRFMFRTFGRARMRLGSEWVVDAWDGDMHHATWEQELRAGEPVDVHIEYAAVPDQRWREVTFGMAPPTAGDPVAEAVELARSADVAVVVAGLGPDWESEGWDRASLVLPRDQDGLIAAVAEAQPDTVVVLTSGSPVELPWRDDVRAVMQAWYGGQEVGHAVADVLTGRAEPAGRLPITWPADSRQHPGLLSFPGEAGEVRYGEGPYVGYRAYDRLGLEPAFSFGHGGSYADLELTAAAAERADDGLRVRATVANRSDRRGTEVVQVYVRDLGGVERRLVGFTKAGIDASTTVEVEVAVAPDQLRWWDPATDGWAGADGEIELEVTGVGGTRSVRAAAPAATGR
jgi:beta-glucosidase